MPRPDETDLERIPAVWLTADAAMLRSEASMHRNCGSADNLDPDDLDWALVVDLSLTVLHPVMASDDPVVAWRTWLDGELAMFDDEHPERADFYRSMLAGETEDDPIVITVEPDRVQIWDGWHRTACRIASGASTIPAIVGTVRGGAALANLPKSRAEPPM